MEKFCCTDYKYFYDLGFVWYSEEDEVWYINVYRQEFDNDEVHEIYCCLFCGKKLKRMNNE